MTAKRRENRHLLEREETRPKVIGWLIEGKGPSEIAQLVSTPRQPVTRQAVAAFYKRHEQEIASAHAQVGQAIVDIAIKDKEQRIRKLDYLFARCEGEVGEYGVMTTEERTFGTGGEAKRVTTRRFNGGLVKEMRALLRDVAEELGQISSPAPSVNIDNRSLTTFTLTFGGGNDNRS